MEEVYMTFPQSLCFDHTTQFQQLVYTLLKLFKRLRMLPSIPGEDIPLLSGLALYHDIGKTALPDTVVYKAGKLTETEFDLMKEHTTLGAKMVAVLPELQGEKEQQYAREICLYHHERWDGSGYPDRLAGDSITPWVQVVGLADAFDALIHPRVYKPAYPQDQASDMIVSGACGIFNPLLLACFAQHIGEIYAVVYSSDG